MSSKPNPVRKAGLTKRATSHTFLALAVWAGVRLTSSLGLRAPAFEAIVTGRPIGPALRSQLLSGLIAEQSEESQYDLHPDGQRLLVRRPVEDLDEEKGQTFDHVVLFENFFEYLRVQVPPR